MTDLHLQTLTELAAGLDTGDFSAVELTDALLGRIEADGETLNAFITVTAEQARAAVEGAELIVHCASLHPWKPYTDDQYLDCNLKGAWHVFAAAALYARRRLCCYLTN